MSALTKAILTHDSWQLLTLIFGEEWEKAWVCWKSNMAGCRVEDLPSDVPDDEDIYFSIAEITQGASTRSLATADRVKALVVDDVGTKISKDAFELMAPAPNWVVESSAGNFQYGYCVDMSVQEFEDFRRGMKSNPIWGKADGIDAVHLFRLPQGRNTKNPQNIFSARLISISETPVDLTGLGGPVQGSSGSPSMGCEEPLEPGALKALVDLIPNDQPERERWVSMAHAIWGASEGAGFQTFALWAGTWSVGIDNPEKNTLLWDSITKSSIGTYWLVREAGAAGQAWWQAQASVVFDDGVLALPDDDDDEVLALQRDVTNWLVRKYGDRLRFNVSTGMWHKFDGTWKESPYPLGFRLAKQWADQAAPQLGKAARASVSKAAFYEGVEKMLKAEPSIAVVKTDFDVDDWLLGTPGGTVDLRTGVLRASVASEMISLSTVVAPAEKEDCPRWLKFIDWACTDPGTGKVDIGLRKSLRQWLGYCLTGDVAKEAVLFMHGGGSNGKGTVIETVQHVMGSYFYMATKDLFMETKFGTHTEETAALAGKRMVAADEVPTQARWNESLLKACSGGGTMSSRHLYSKAFTFPIKFKVTIIGNSKPSFQGEINMALRRRLHLAGFLNTANPVDDTLKGALKAEAPGVLRWMLNGLVELQSEGGWHIADSMISATEDYFNENDLFGEWLAERTEKAPGADAPSSKLYEDWREWLRARGAVSNITHPRVFKSEMEKRGNTWRETKNGNVFKNLKQKIF